MSGRIATNGVVLAYDCFGDPGGPAIIGLQGLAEGKRFWPSGLITALVTDGYRVILLDNRDIGESTILHGAGRVDLPRLVSGLNEPVPYTLTDMARDTITVMDALAVRSAHVVGYSLGGMVAQWMAIDFPERVRSLALLMSSSGAPALPAPDQSAGAALMQLAEPDDGNPKARIETLWTSIQGRDPEDGAAFVDLLMAVGYRPDAVNRQLAAGFGSPPRHDLLARVTHPTTVIHGTDDPVFPLAHGTDLAARLPDASLEQLNGAGHALTASVTRALTIAMRAHLADVEQVVA